MFTSKQILQVVVFLIFPLLNSCEKSIELKYKKTNLTDEWQIHPSDNDLLNGKSVSVTEFNTTNWYATTIPSTVMGALTANGLYDDAFMGTNIKNIDKTQFENPWWYRTVFSLDSIGENQKVFLHFDGISYSADIWLNGNLIASKDSIYGPYRQYSFDVTPYILEKNCLAVEVHKAQSGNPNIGFADWNPRPADENMGIFREVYLTVTGNAILIAPHIKSEVNTSTLAEAWLTVDTKIQNLSDTPLEGELIGKFDSKSFSFPVKLAPNETKNIQLTSEDIAALYVKNPRLWWCNNLGNPELYNMELSFRVKDAITYQDTITFGIRQIESYFTEKGHRGFMLNGRKILLKSAGWTDDIYLRDTPESNEIQIQYVKDMNLNMIRFENFWGTSSNVYDLCDKYGLLAIIGWSCQWEWETYYGKPCSEIYGCIQFEEEIDLIARSFADQVVWLRNHPSIIAWMPGSDMLQHPDLEQKYLDFLREADDRIYVGAAKMRTSELSGQTGTKMEGPYEYVGPNYWYVDTLFGGAFGFNTETGIGAQLPVLESIQKFIPKDKLWPVSNEEWNFHCTTSSTAMNSLSELTKVMDNKYGKAKNLADYLLKADLINYDGTRAMFEAFRANLGSSTGIVQWMLNSAWPSLYWQLYDFYQIPTAAYYSVKKANQPIQLIYNYGNNSVSIVNEQLTDLLDCKAIIQVLGIDSELKYIQEMRVDALNNISKQIFTLDTLAENSFLSLELYNNAGELLADNFYCISSKEDEYKWEETNWVHTPAKVYSDFKNLSELPLVDLEISVKVRENKETEEIIYSVQLHNTSNAVSFFNSLKLKIDEETMLTPVFWSDNYVSLLPEQRKTIECRVKKAVLKNENPYLEIKAWNSSKQIIEI